jgi:MFS family permease
MLLISMVLFLTGSILCAISPTYPLLIASNTVARIGNGALAPLCFAVLGDMLPPVQRSRWVGLLNIPQGIFAVVGPTLGGWFVDNLSWRHLYWIGVPLLVVCVILVPIGIPAPAKKIARKIDVRGALLVAVASSATILGISFAGTRYPWASVQIFGLMGTALLFWILFFKAESRVQEPIMDPQVFRNRTFLTVAVAGILSFFGLMAMMMYYPIFLQGVHGHSVMKSGQILTPFNVLVAFIGVPTGFALARWKRYKWMYISGYGLLTAILFCVVFFDAQTSVALSVAAATLCGLGLGVIPTINTLVVQYAVPKKMLGVAMGAIFFSITMGMAISPAVLGAAMNYTYARTLERSLPTGLQQYIDKNTMASIGDPKALLSPKGMAALKATFRNAGAEGEALFNQTVGSIRTSLESGLQSVFLLGAITMLLAFLLILTVPEISMDPT